MLAAGIDFASEMNRDEELTLHEVAARFLDRGKVSPFLGLLTTIWRIECKGQ